MRPWRTTGVPSTRLLGRLISEPQNPLWDDKNTPEVEDAAQIMRRAYAETEASLTSLVGAARAVRESL